MTLAKNRFGPGRNPPVPRWKVPSNSPWAASCRCSKDPRVEWRRKWETKGSQTGLPLAFQGSGQPCPCNSFNKAFKFYQGVGRNMGRHCAQASRWGVSPYKGRQGDRTNVIGSCRKGKHRAETMSGQMFWFDEQNQAGWPHPAPDSEAPDAAFARFQMQECRNGHGRCPSQSPGVDPTVKVQKARLAQR